MPMKKAIKTKWLKMLRSGKYEQARHALMDTTYDPDDGTTVVGYTYCCLAVLALAAGAKHAVDYEHPLIWGDELQDGVLGDKLRDHVGLDGLMIDKLVNKNDDQRWRFPRIADWVEKHL